MAAPIPFAFAALGAAFAFGAFSGDWADLSVYLFHVALGLWLLIGLAVPLEYAWGLNRVFFLGWFSLVGGAVALGSIGLVFEERYLKGSPQTEWIREAGLPIALLVTLGAVLLVARGMWLGRLDRRRGASDIAAQRYLVSGTFVGATSFLLIELAVAYDLGELIS
jgi:hypothetical protein